MVRNDRYDRTGYKEQGCPERVCLSHDIGKSPSWPYLQAVYNHKGDVFLRMGIAVET